VRFSELLAFGISVKTLSNTNLELDNQVSVMESHPVAPDSVHCITDMKEIYNIIYL
jgi:hypothetical protein